MLSLRVQSICNAEGTRSITAANGQQLSPEERQLMTN